MQICLFLFFIILFFVVLKQLCEVLEDLRTELIHEGATMRSNADVYLGCSGSSPVNIRRTIWLNTRASILRDPSSAQQLGGPRGKPTSA